VRHQHVSHAFCNIWVYPAEIQCRFMENTAFTPFSLPLLYGNLAKLAAISITFLHTLDMIRRASILVFIFIYFLTPYSIKRLDSGCACGCGEFICTCCTKAHHLKNTPCFAEHSCSAEDESYEQSPSMTESFFTLTIILRPIDNVRWLKGGAALPGYRRPPMKPPPLA
jgi:hypothetical protein